MGRSDRLPVAPPRDLLHRGAAMQVFQIIVYTVSRYAAYTLAAIITMFPDIALWLPDILFNPVDRG